MPKQQDSITLDDLSIEDRAALEKQFYQSFDMMKLYEPVPEESSIILKWLPAVSTILTLITLIFVVK